MNNPNPYRTSLRKIGIILLFLGPLTGLSQVIIKSEVLPRIKYEYLLKSPTSLSCDSLGEFKVIMTYYKNAMPMADNDKLIWSCWIGKGVAQPQDGANEAFCAKLDVKKIYLFYEKEVYIYSYSKGPPDKDPKKIYTPPLVVVIEYFDRMEQKTGYIKSNAQSFIDYGSVE